MNINELNQQVKEKHHVDVDGNLITNILRGVNWSTWQKTSGRSIMERVAGNPQNVSVRVENGTVLLGVIGDLAAEEYDALGVLVRGISWVGKNVMKRSIQDFRENPPDSLVKGSWRLQQVAIDLMKSDVQLEVIPRLNRYSRIQISRDVQHMTKTEKELQAQVMGTILSTLLTNRITP